MRVTTGREGARPLLRIESSLTAGSCCPLLGS